MKNNDNCNIEKVFSKTGEVLRKEDFVLTEPIFEKILPKLPITKSNFETSNLQNYEKISFFDVVKNVFAPVLVGAILLVLIFRFFGEEKNFYVPIELKLKNDTAKQVEIVGDFTNWQPVRLKNRDGLWYAKFYLKPGRYRYIYIIDKNTYFLEPEREVLEDDFGNKNSVIII